MMVYALRHPPAEDGQGLMEYAMILILVAIIVMAVLFLLGPIVANNFYRSIVSSI